jgi:hypothetical protein
MQAKRMRMRFLDDRLEVRAAHSQATKTKPPAISSAGRCGYSLQFPPFLPVFFESCPSAVQPCTHALPAVRCSAHSGAGVCTPAVHFSARALPAVPAAALIANYLKQRKKNQTQPWRRQHLSLQHVMMMILLCLLAT